MSLIFELLCAGLCLGTVQTKLFLVSLLGLLMANPCWVCWKLNCPVRKYILYMN